MKPKGFMYICNQFTEQMKRDAFQAIADPTRRKILGMLSDHSLNVNEVSSHFKVSRTAIYKHMKLLQECGMLEIRKEGREHVCSAKLEPLSEVKDWIETYRKFWSSKLDDLEDYLKAVQSKEKKHKNVKKQKHGIKKK